MQPESIRVLLATFLVHLDQYNGFEIEQVPSKFLSNGFWVRMLVTETELRTNRNKKRASQQTKHHKKMRLAGSAHFFPKKIILFLFF